MTINNDGRVKVGDHVRAMKNRLAWGRIPWGKGLVGKVTFIFGNGSLATVAFDNSYIDPYGKEKLWADFRTEDLKVLSSEMGHPDFFTVNRKTGLIRGVEFHHPNAKRCWGCTKAAEFSVLDGSDIACVHDGKCGPENDYSQFTGKPVFVPAEQLERVKRQRDDEIDWKEFYKRELDFANAKVEEKVRQRDSLKAELESIKVGSVQRAMYGHVEAERNSLKKELAESKAKIVELEKKYEGSERARKVESELVTRAIARLNEERRQIRRSLVHPKAGDDS